ncbi:ElyC/SanA/YdcF family protein [Sedimentibacter sp.]|uniref:SanA/YdcF family protein n=1 Tax=Sedimentibacter sp. TaxID=1960295 RepID=UPI002897F1D5|nr:ElyC/SanA/YdcF family protein [Sedimentibacter sp.]
MKKSLKFAKRASAAFLILAAVVFLSVIFINAYVKSSTEDLIISVSESLNVNPDCIIVLGAGVRADGSPSPMLQDRLITGIKLYEDGVSDRMIMSGDHTKKGYDEVNIMKKYAIDKGIPSEHIFMDHAGISTYDSIYRAKEIFQADKIIIVTQKYHLYRALHIAERLGVEAYGISADVRTYAGQDLRELREKAARVKDFIKAVMKPDSKIGGEAIPVSGNGDVTND